MFSASSNIIISNLIKFLFVFSVDGFSLSVKDSVGGYDAVVFWFGGYYLKLNWFEVSSHDKEVTFFYWSISILEVWDQEGFGEITTDTFNGVLNGKHVDFCQIGHLTGRPDLDNITKSDSEIFPDDLVHSDFAVL